MNNVKKEEIKRNIISYIVNDYQKLDEMLDEEVALLIQKCIDKFSLNTVITLKEKINLKTEIYNSLKKYDILTELLDDKTVNEIMINGIDEIFIDRKGKIEKWGKCFSSNEQLYNIIQQIVGKINRIVNVKNPIVDARLQDGSRVHIVLPPIAIKGPTITIRKFPEKFSIEKLIKNGTIDENLSLFIRKLVLAKYNIFISGGTGSGKTTFLNALSEYIPKDERVITIEDSAELNISHVENLVSLETRNSNIEGEGAIDMSMLIKASLRMNPDRIVVGEVRGKEAFDMLNGFNTGHDGSMSTGHANSSIDMLTRLETMVLMAESLSMKAIRQQISSSIDIIIHLTKLKNKKRVVEEVLEIEGLEDDKYKTNKLYEYQKGNFVKLNEIKNTRKLDTRL